MNDNEKPVTVSKTVKSIIGAVLLLAAFLGAAFAFDSRYLHVAQFEKYADDQKREILDDKIFELDQKDKLDKKDKAFYERYKRKLDELNKKLEKEK